MWFSTLMHSAISSKTYRLVLLFVVVAFASSCNAPSCGPLEDHFYVQCSNVACDKAFRARQVPFQFGDSCMRRFVVEEVPFSVIHPLQQVISKSGFVLPKAGIYHVSLWDHPYYHKRLERAEDLARILPEIAQEDVNRGKVRDVQIRAVESVRGETDFEQLKNSWLDREQKDSIPVKVFYVVDALGLALLLYTTAKFRSACVGNIQTPRLRKPAIYVAIQLGLLVLSQLFLLQLLSLASAIALIYDAILYTGVRLKR